MFNHRPQLSRVQKSDNHISIVQLPTLTTMFKSAETTESTSGKNNNYHPS